MLGSARCYDRICLRHNEFTHQLLRRIAQFMQGGLVVFLTWVQAGTRQLPVRVDPPIGAPLGALVIVRRWGANMWWVSERHVPWRSVPPSAVFVLSPST